MADEVEKIFKSLDVPFINFNRNIEPIIWQCKDILVQSVYELKIPALAGATIKYTFSTTIGDIMYSTEFVPDGQGPELITESMRVPSDVEPIKGSYKAELNGTFVFLFDNSYSWFNPKMLTYNVQLFQPAFTIADNNRALQSYRLLQNTKADVQLAKIRLSNSEERVKHVDSEISNLEIKMLTLQKEIENKKISLQKAYQEVDEMNKLVKYNEEKKTGLCIRCLDKKGLSNVLAFAGKTPGTYLACKYWKACIDDLQENKS